MWEDQARRGGRTELGSSPAQQQQRDRAGGARGRQRKGEPLLAGKGAGPSAAERQSGRVALGTGSSPCRLLGSDGPFSCRSPPVL